MQIRLKLMHSDMTRPQHDGRPFLTTLSRLFKTPIDIYGIAPGESTPVSYAAAAERMEMCVQFISQIKEHIFKII